MAIRTRNRISTNFSFASMTDIIFLLNIFFLLTSTMVHPTALKLLLPVSNTQTSAKPMTTVSITSDLQYYVENRRIPLENLERTLQQEIGENKDIYISLHVDQSVAIEHVVKVMNIAKNNEYKLILATRAK